MGPDPRPAHSGEPVAIVGGTGAQGSGLALRWAAAGIPVRLGSREAARAQAAAASLRQRLREEGAAYAQVDGRDNAEAVAGAGIVVLTVPFAAQAATLRGLRDSLAPEQVLIDVTVPLATAVGGPATGLVGVWAGSAAEQAASLVPRGVHVCAAFHHVAAPALANLRSPVDTDVLVCGSSRQAKQRVRPLVDALPGARFVDAGPLERARLLEPLAALLIGLNVRYHTTRAGVRFTGLEMGEP